MPNTTPIEAGFYLDEFDSDRFWAHVTYRGGTAYESDPLASAVGECWIWNKGFAVGAYGRFKLLGRWMQAHRVAYRDFGNPLPDTLDIDHLCRNLQCVRPSHGEAVSTSENVSRGLRGRASHPDCPHGHPYSEENTKWQTRNGKQQRYCRICLAASKHRSYERSKLKRGA